MIKIIFKYIICELKKSQQFNHNPLIVTSLDLKAYALPAYWLH